MSNHQEEKQAIDEKRRELIRKAGYSAPVLVVLGLAAHSPKAAALGNPPSAPVFDGTSQEDEELLEDIEQQQKSKGD